MDVEVTDGIFVNGRGQKLKTYAYRPKELRCVLFFHHGFGKALCGHSSQRKSAHRLCLTLYVPTKHNWHRDYHLSSSTPRCFSTNFV